MQFEAEVTPIVIVGKPLTPKQFADTLDHCGRIMERCSFEAVTAFFVSTAEVAAHTYLGMPR